MSYVVRWSREAELSVVQNMDYISQKWGNNVLQQFTADVETALKQIKAHPLTYPLHPNTNDVRKYKINKRIVLYYRIIEETIELLTFWNTYRNPDNLNIRE